VIVLPFYLFVIDTLGGWSNRNAFGSRLKTQVIVITGWTIARKSHTFVVAAFILFAYTRRKSNNLCIMETRMRWVGHVARVGRRRRTHIRYWRERQK
jgi:hypothetical protein